MRAPLRNTLLLAVVLVAAAAVLILAFGEDPAPPGPAPDTARKVEPQAPPTEGTQRILASSDLAADEVRVHGRVLDAWGEAVAQALVGDAAADRPVPTAGDGTFVLGVERGTTALPLLVLANGHAPWARTLDVPAGAVVFDAGDLQLLRGGSLRGVVLDGDQHGIAGAAVSLTLRAQGGTAPPPDLVAPAVTDASGAWAFPNLMPGSYRVEARLARMQTGSLPQVAVADGAETVADAIVLAPGYALRGVVLGPGEQAIAQAAVRVRSRGSQARFDGRIETDAGGRFALDAVPPGELTVEVAKTGFLRQYLTGVDATRGDELVVRLAAGLRIEGTVVDARTNAPVERFAVTCRRTGDLDPGTNGTAEQQLQRQVEQLQLAAANAPDAAQGATKAKLAAEFAERLASLRREERTRPAMVPADVGPAAAQPGGRFAVDGLEQGIYSVGIASPEHQFAQSAPVELRVGGASPELSFRLVEGAVVRGIVRRKGDRAPVGGADVELVHAFAMQTPANQQSLYPWVFAQPVQRGVVLMRVRTSGDGTFAFPEAQPGRYHLSVRHATLADHDTPPFDLGAEPRELVVDVGTRASLSGRIGMGGVARDVSVLVLGGHGIMRTVRAAADGTYHVQGLNPGSYLVRAFPTDQTQYVQRLVGSLFPEHAGAVDPKAIPPRDVTLAEGEERRLDLALDMPATGALNGVLSINGRPGKGARAVMAPVPGEAPGAGNLSLRGVCDDVGRFAIQDAPAGNYTLILQGPSGQELQRGPFTIAPGVAATVEKDLVAGGLRGQVRTADGAPPAELRGTIWVLPGAKEAPADPYEYRRTNRTHRVQVQNGAFEDLFLTPGPAVLLVEIRGRARTVVTAVVPAAGAQSLELQAGDRVQ